MRSGGFIIIQLSLVRDSARSPLPSHCENKHLVSPPGPYVYVPLPNPPPWTRMNSADVWSSNEIMSATIFLDLPHIAKGILWLLQIVRKIRTEKKRMAGLARFPLFSESF